MKNRTGLSEDSVMDSAPYSRFSGSDPDDSFQGPKFTLRPGRRVKLMILLYSVVLFLLLVLLLVSAVKFSQLNQEMLSVKLFLISINSSLLHVGEAPPKAEHYTGGLTNGQGSCKDSWVSFRSSCYQISTKRLPWEGAERKCVEMGAHLIVINDAEEQFIRGNDLAEQLWIGLVERENEDRWTWVDGTDFTTTLKFWDVGQPDDWSQREDCGQLHGNGLWNDADCSSHFKYICEMPAN
ncbi:hepatic lectin-like isoform X2 [Brienomyrus brachyistius]|uniref:hepatic lectin-like isoform X2 n=1 Tax=Brienomyrus brachyistius TaxID=42636 RepID=UPI0020B2C456|nr:hepatic lectin-like isoform X2 [Brienomyrus brachyistius]